MRSPHGAAPVRTLSHVLSHVLWRTLAGFGAVAVVICLAAPPSASYAASDTRPTGRVPASSAGAGAGAPVATASLPQRPAARATSARKARAALSPALRSVLRLVNVARATPRSCGAVRYPATRPVRANLRLNRAATRFARLLGARDFFSHTSPDGTEPGDRIRAAGYRWQAYGENIAAGFTTPASVVQGWLDSPGHCENLMNPAYTEIGLGYAHQDGSSYGHYWVQDFARPM